MNSSKRTKTPARVERLDPATSALPIRVAQAGTTIEGRETVVVTQHYADRILVIVSQVGKIGALTQVSTHKRPSFPPMLDDDDYDDHAGPGSNAPPPPTHSVSMQALFGSVPTGQETLYDLYKEQIAALILAQIQTSAGAATESGLETKPIIVGLSLALERRTAQGSDDDDGDDGDDVAEVADGERKRFQAILALVTEARTW